MIQTKKHQTALVYCRVSTWRQVVEKFGLDTQEDVCKRWCETNEIPIIKIVKDQGISGGTFDREGLDEVLDILGKQQKFLQKNAKRKKPLPIPRIL